MPYRVTKTTRLYADHQGTNKQGWLAPGTEFECSAFSPDDASLEKSMLRVKGEVLCDDGHMDGGWVSGAHVDRILTGPRNPAPEPIPVVLKAGRYRISGEVTIEELSD